MQTITNHLYEITITSDSRFSLEKDSHPEYDYVLNPDSWQSDENYTAARITVRTAEKQTVIALLGPIESDFNDLGVLDGNTLYVMMGSGITAIDLNDLPSHAFHQVEADGYTHGLFHCSAGFLIVCTYGILMCDGQFRELWHYSTDAPVTACRMEEERIVLIDEDDNRHHIGYHGRRVN